MFKENQLVLFRESQDQGAETLPVDSTIQELNNLAQELGPVDTKIDLSKEDNDKDPDTKFDAYFEVTTGALIERELPARKGEG